MGKIIGKDFEDIIESIRDSKSAIGGGVATVLTGLTATSLARKTLDAVTHSHEGRITKEEATSMDWEMEDAEIHYVNLLDKDREASEAICKLDKPVHEDGLPVLTVEEVYRSALSVSAAISTGAARVLRITSRLAEIAPSEFLADVGIATQMLYATFIGGRMKLNHYFVHAPEMDKDFIAKTRGKVYELEDEISKLVGESLERVWKALHPKEI